MLHKKCYFQKTAQFISTRAGKGRDFGHGWPEIGGPCRKRACFGHGWPEIGGPSRKRAEIGHGWPLDSGIGSDCSLEIEGVSENHDRIKDSVAS